MGNWNSRSAGANPGPGLTPNEQTGQGNTSTDEWLKGLEDRTSPVRKRVVGILCPAVFDSVSMDVVFPDLANQLLDACVIDRGRRTKMLQTPFLDGQNPIAWTICNYPASLLSSPLGDRLPAVLGTLLECCGGLEQLPIGVVDTIHGACCIRNCNELFQLLNPEAKTSDSRTPVYTVAYRGAVLTTERLEFVIHDFPGPMLVKGRVDMRFICESRLYSVGFAVRGSTNNWVLFRRLVQDHSNEKGFFGWSRVIHVDLKKEGGEVRPEIETDMFVQFITRHCVYENQDLPAEKLKIANDFIGKDRKLKGIFRIAKA